MRRTLTVTTCLAALALSGGVPAIAAAAPAECFNRTVPLTVEEQRLSAGANPAAPRLVQAGGLDRVVTDFRAALCAATSAGGAETVVTAAGERLWTSAVNRAQGRAPAGTLDRYDDRPLYWARLQMASALRQWSPSFTVARAALLTNLDRGSRGLRSVTLPAGGRRVLVSGFDPFGFYLSETRLSNPSGSAALQLDGRVLSTPDGPVVVEAVALPVTWTGFDAGIVEAAFGPALKDASRRPHALVTISQGAAFNIERWAAGWRGGYPDNNKFSSTGQVPKATGWPASPKTLIETTLPAARMISAKTGPQQVFLNQTYCFWPAGTTPGTGDVECRYDGTVPKPGEVGASGGGGDFLSNESMFRANRLRIGLGATAVRGGHLHIPPVPRPGADALTDKASEATRRAVVDQTVALVGVAGA